MFYFKNGKLFFLWVNINEPHFSKWSKKDIQEKSNLFYSVNGGT